MWPRIRDLLQRVDLTQMRELEELFVQAVDSASRLEPEVTLSPSGQHTRRIAKCRGGKAKPARMTHDDDLRPIRAQWNPHLFSYYHNQPQCCRGEAGLLSSQSCTHTPGPGLREARGGDLGLWSCHKPDAPGGKWPIHNIPKSSPLLPGFHTEVLAWPSRIMQARECWEMSFQLR